jgi:hypothetical protein
VQPRRGIAAEGGHEADSVTLLSEEVDIVEDQEQVLGQPTLQFATELSGQ